MEPPQTPGAGTPGGPDWNKLTQAKGPDRLILVAGVVFVVAMFLPFFTVAGYSENGIHGFTGLLAFLLGLLATIFAVIRTLGVKMNLGTLKDGMLYIILGGGTLVFTILHFLFKPSGLGVVKIGWGFGAFIALAASVVLALGGWQKYQSAPK